MFAFYISSYWHCIYLEFALHCDCIIFILAFGLHLHCICTWIVFGFVFIYALHLSLQQVCIKIIFVLMVIKDSLVPRLEEKPPSYIVEDR